MTRMGPALPTREAAAYLGWAYETLKATWRQHAHIRRGAIRCGKRLTFLVSALDAHNRAHLVSREVSRA